ncbi:1,2-phenylacetyl-CoA epoxidase subunit PaaD [Deminuibacter soli]|uniref:Phenylacetate-CoA oxygenase subunit PaaJ n=1 Tax=Deminuibacter soli TaxID=2291815 RepID=A0A3E1NPU8_9BACT|nr:1,2-phenylacetyl-CoA epoxidase subunit PaaD [Deminuibacter soli]RFM29943.1 phenylacetate-CoA oxygenase subunit PaaJ [Deminuibacter soli]
MTTSPQPLTTANIWQVLETVHDPEIPVLSVIDLGIVREVTVQQNEVHITITPTYSGCPAVDAIRMHIRLALLQQGIHDIHIHTSLSPAWTTEWLTEAGKNKLKSYGIAPPLHLQQVCSPDAFQREEAVPCPRCNSHNTHMISRFGATACKALYQCNDCHEPFDYFKCH